jgi:pyruvate dehydrogenase E2 component (dihydrolipoamide acetyltransferase)
MSSNKGETRIEEPTRAQRTVARRAAESRATVPHLELSSDVVVAEDRDILPLAVSACARALRQFPRANASYRDGRFELYSRVNVGVALATEDAYVIATVFDADARAMAEIAAEVERLRERAARGELSPPDLSGATFTVSEAGAKSGGPLIVPPQAAALSLGTVREAPVVRAGAIVAASSATITLACDHRILFGAYAAEFLAAIASAMS